MALESRRQMPIREEWRYPAVLAIVTSLMIGVMVGRSPSIAFLIALAPAVAVLATRSATAWVALAVLVAVAFRGLAGLHVAPGYGQFAHIPLAWGALCIALLRGRPDPLGRRCLLWLALLGSAVVVSTIANQSQPLRGLVYFLLLAEPFAIVCALLIDPPSYAQRRLLLGTCAALVAVQVPLSYWQAYSLGWGDPVQGTLYGSGAGAHVIAAVVIVGAFWYVGRARAPFSPRSIAVVAAMAGIVLIADAKQVTFALPVVILAQRSLSARSIAIGLVAIVAIFAVVHVQTFNQGYAIPYVDRALAGHSGKQAVASMIWHDASGDAGTLAVGQGPAETVSRAAMETLPQYQDTGSTSSTLQALGLAPAQTAIKANQVAAVGAGQLPGAPLDSFDSALSSGIGLFGDLGLLGFVAYTGLFTTVFLNVRRRASPEALAAACGLAMLFVLGFVLDWWEEPAFTVFLGTLAGVALTQPTVRACPDLAP
jgi:hypothetical protein